jgi:hypothetical protein
LERRRGEPDEAACWNSGQRGQLSAGRAPDACVDFSGCATAGLGGATMAGFGGAWTIGLALACGVVMIGC